MPLSELPLSVLVALFLAVFVLIGINPALQRAAKGLRKLLHAAVQARAPFATRPGNAHAELFAEHPAARQLNDFEIIVVRRLAQAGGRALTRKQVNAPLLLGKAVLHRTLDSLVRRRLVRVRLSMLPGQRFALAAAGRRYALEQGYMVRIHQRPGLLRSNRETSGRALILLLGIVLLPLSGVLAEDDRLEERLAMVTAQVAARGVKDPVTLAAMRKVPRHHFVPAEQAPFAYDDRPLPIGHGQTISQPFIVAYMTETIQPGPGTRILEVGTGSGYQAAILAAAGAEVYSIEIIPALADAAATRLRQLGYPAVMTRASDGYYGWAEHAPFDAIIVTAAAEFVPPPLIAQLKDGGLMIIPVGSPFFVQTLMLVQKRGETTTSTSLMPVRFVPFRRAE